MGGRNAKSIGLHLAEGNPNRLTKEEIQARKDAEIKLGKTELDKLRPPTFVKNDTVAFAYWKQHLKEYKAAAAQGVDILTSSDVGTLALYCKTYSEYERLLVQYQRIERIAIDESLLHEYIEQAEEADEINLKALRYLSQLASVEGILKIETAINKKMDMLLKLQDRLFLNPLAKVKNVPKPKKPEEKPKKFGKFGAARGG